MSRVIKFRAWDSRAKKMFQDAETYKPEFAISMTGAPLIKDDNGACGDPECCGSYEEYMTAAHPNQYVVMQFTGLLDKNGKEIYEDDIIDVGTGYRCAIEWDQGSMEPWGAYFDTPRADWAVIGNIHENPELLEAP